MTDLREIAFHIPSAPQGVTVGEATEAQLHEMLALQDFSSAAAVLEIERRGLALPGWYDDPRNHVAIGWVPNLKRTR